jgi:hypothetical protein
MQSKEKAEVGLTNCKVGEKVRKGACGEPFLFSLRASRLQTIFQFKSRLFELILASSLHTAFQPIKSILPIIFTTWLWRSKFKLLEAEIYA